MNPTYQHIKSGNLYEVLHMNVINATNINNDINIIMVLYKPKDKDDLFVREKSEFLEKFKIV